MKDVLIYRTENDHEVFEIRDTMHNGARVERKAYLIRGETIWEMRLGLYSSLDPAQVKRLIWQLASKQQ